MRTSEARPDQVSAERCYVVAGHSVQGRRIEVIELGSGGRVVFFLAAIHGSEPSGEPLLEKLVDELKKNPQHLKGLKVVVMPAANPDGLAKKTRVNVNGVDLNRNFPASNRINSERFGKSALSEPEARCIHRLVRKYMPVCVVSLHQPLSCVDYDGPARKLAKEMSALSGLPVKKLGAQPGSMGAYVGEKLRIPIITLELPRESSDFSRKKLWALYGRALLHVLKSQRL